MRYKLQFISFYLIILCLYACNDSYPKIILEVEDIIKVHPDSALVILDSLKQDIAKESESARMYYNLLLTEARDRCYVPHTSDSLMASVVSYYEKKNDTEKLVKAYYYMGRVYADLQDSSTALTFFHKALDASEGIKDYILLGRIYSQMGTLFAYEELTEDVLQTYRKAYYYFQLGKDSLTSAYALRDLGRAFNLLEMPDSCLYYYKKASKLADNNGDRERELNILQELASFYIERDKYGEALEILRKTHGKWYNSKDPDYGIWGDYYRGIGQKDSAMHYFKKGIGHGNIYADQGAYWNLYELEKETGNYEKALSYLETYTEYSDSIHSLTDTESLRKIQALYDYQHIEKERAELREENMKQKIWLLCIGIALVLGVIALVVYDRNRKIVAREQEERLRETNEKQYLQSQQYIEENKKKIQELQTRLELMQQERSELHQQLLLTEKVRLEQTNQAIETSQKERALREEALRSSEIYAYCYRANNDPSIVFDDEDWKRLEDAINEAYDNFTGRLFRLRPALTTMELHICMLTKIQLPISTISQLVCRTQSAVSMSRKQLYKKIFNKSGTAAAMDEFIIAF